jgi:flagellar motor switch protein FliM
MAEGDRILSQQEVDALLSAIDSGEVEVKLEAAEAAPGAVPYDFKRPERVPREQLRALETLHEFYARGLQSALAGMLRAGVEVRVAAVDQLTYLEFVGSLPNPTAFTVLSADPLGGSFILEINPSVAFPIVERLLGSGQLGRSQPERSLTRIEWNLIDTVIARALDLMKELWAPIAPVTFRVTAREANPRLMQVLSPNESVVSVTLDVAIGEQKGSMNLCIPVVAIEGHLEEISSHVWLSSRKEMSAPGQETAITRQLAPADVRISAHLPVEEMELKVLESLRPGDLLVTGHPSTAPVLVSLEGRPKFRAAVGRWKDRLAFKVVGRADEHAGSPRERAALRRAEDPSGGGAGKGPSMREALQRVPLTASAVLAEKSARVRDVLALRPGQVLEFSKRADEPLALVVGGRLLAEGAAVKIGDRFGLQIESLRGSRPEP